MRVHTGPGGTPPQGPVRQVQWFAMTGSVFVYALVAFFVTRGGVERSTVVSPWLLAGVAAVVAVAGLVLYRRVAEDAAAKPDRDPHLIRPMEMAVWALDDAVAVLGVVGALVSGSFTLVPVHTLVALVLLALHRPR